VSVGLAFVVKKTIAHPALFELFCSRMVAELELGAGEKVDAVAWMAVRLKN
jgi:hypothetical protein